MYYKDGTVGGWRRVPLALLGRARSLTEQKTVTKPGNRESGALGERMEKAS